MSDKREDQSATVRSSIAINASMGLRGQVEVPGDKSISHRLTLLLPLCDGMSKVVNILNGRDCLATQRCMTALGANITTDGRNLVFAGAGDSGLPISRRLQEPDLPLDCQNSGTTMRLLAGLLAPQGFLSILTGSKQLNTRPMGRIIEPLRSLGFNVSGRKADTLAPIVLAPSRSENHGRTEFIKLKRASAQVQSCLALAAFFGGFELSIQAPGPVRDHTFHLLTTLGANLEQSDNTLYVSAKQPERLAELDYVVPGDPSSASFLMTAALITKNSAIELRNVLSNPTRTGLLHAFQAMGAEIEIVDQRIVHGEAIANWHVKTSELKSIEIGGQDIVTMIDEVPLLALAATQASGKTVIRHAAELRVKECDRITETVRLLKGMGAEITELEDGFEILGPTPLHATRAPLTGDHRMVMNAAVAAVATQTGSLPTILDEAELFDDSFPGFIDCLQALSINPITDDSSF